MAIASASGAAVADDLATIPLDQLLDLEVSGASKFPLRTSESASSATVISGDEIRALGYRTLADALQSVRGVVASSDRTYAYLGVRGFAVAGDYNTRILLLIDGNRANDTVYDQAFLGSEFPVDLALVDRIEFIPGQGSAVHGGNALFGVINVVTRRAVANTGSEAALTVGSGGLRELRMTNSRRISDDAWLLVSASARRFSGTDATYPTLAGPGTEGGVSHKTDHERGEQLHFKYEHAEMVGSISFSDRTKGLSATPGAVFGDPRNAYRDAITLANLTWSHRVDAQQSWKLRAYAGDYTYRGDYMVDYPPVTMNHDRAESRWWGVEADWFTQQVASHKIVLGTDLQWSPRRDQSNADVDPSATYLDDHRQSQRQSLFIEDQWALSAAHSLTMGLRYDRLSNDAQSSQFSPRLALVTRPTNTLVMKLIYGKAFRAPNAYESHYAIEGTPGYKGNPELRNERVHGTEAVIEYRPSTESRWTLAVYENHAEQLLVQRLDPADNTLVFSNVGSMHARGLELEGERIWPNGFHMRASYSLQRVTNYSTDVLALRTPAGLGKLMVIAPVAKHWTIGTQTTLVSRRGDVAGHGATQLTLSRKGLGNEQGRISATVYDIFDRHADDPGSDSVVQPVAPQDGRRFAMTVEWKF